MVIDVSTPKIAWNQRPTKKVSTKPTVFANRAARSYSLAKGPRVLDGDSNQLSFRISSLVGDIATTIRQHGSLEIGEGGGVSPVRWRMRLSYRLYYNADDGVYKINEGDDGFLSANRTKHNATAV